MKVWWPNMPKPGNIGDILTPWMMRRDGVEPDQVGKGVPGKLLGIGSIARFSVPGDTLWTTGVMRVGEVGSRSVNVKAVRGPFTAAALGLGFRDVPMGDGALCLPHYLKPRDGLKHQLGIVPHYVDLDHREEWPAFLRSESVKVISPLTLDVEGFVNQIWSCQFIYSSSLHGCVIAEAYGIPWRWIRIADRLVGDDVKFHDFLGSLQSYNADDLMEARPWMS